MVYLKPSSFTGTRTREPEGPIAQEITPRIKTPKTNGEGNNNPPAWWVTEEYQIKMEATPQSQECKASSFKKASET
jgi:hypothetical protein